MALADGEKGNPRTELDDDSDFAADLTALSDWAADVADRYRADITGRDSISPVWPGMTVWVVSTQKLYLWTGAEYVTIAGKEAQGSLGYSPGITAQTDVHYLRKDFNDWVTVYYKGAYVSALADGSVIGSLPAGFRPGGTMLVPASGSGGGSGACIARLRNTGEIAVFSITALTATTVEFFARYKAAA